MSHPRRKLIVVLMTLVGCTCAGSTALAAPNGDQASCQAIFDLDGCAQPISGRRGSGVRLPAR
jgi:hypothetical protein